MKITHCKLSKKVQKRLLEFFVLEVTARSAADLLQIHPNSAALLYHKIRLVIETILILKLKSCLMASVPVQSDEFLESIKSSPTKDLWLLAMERFLSSELKEKGGVNLATKKEFEERLKEAMNQYHNHNLSVLEIIEELIALAKEFEARQKRGEELGLNPAEMAFYDALVRNESAVREMGDEVLMKLAKDITDKLRKSVTIDWQYKDSVRAKMRTLIRIALRSYKYPPDLQAEAIEFVIQQAEAIAEDLVESA